MNVNNTIKFYCSTFYLIAFLNLLLILNTSTVHAQQTQSEVTIQGKIVDALSPDLALPNIMIINLRTQLGVFAEGDNTFKIKIFPADTLVVTATGYSVRKFCLKDSLNSKDNFFTIGINKLLVQLKPVTIFKPRDFDKIETDLKKLGYRPSDYKVTGIEAFNSPVTALYQAFSRKERSKRKVAEMENADLRRGLLKELLQIYVNTKLIDLPYEEYDRFIDFLNLDDQTLNSITQYQLALYIKSMYEQYHY